MAYTDWIWIWANTYVVKAMFDQAKLATWSWLTTEIGTASHHVGSQIPAESVFRGMYTNMSLTPLMLITSKGIPAIEIDMPM